MYSPVTHYVFTCIHRSLTIDVGTEKEAFKRDIESSMERLLEVTLVSCDSDQCVNEVMRWYGGLFARATDSAARAKELYVRAFGRIHAEIQAHYSQTVYLLRTNKSLANGLGLMKQIASEEGIDSLEILENTQAKLHEAEKSVAALRGGIGASLLDLVSNVVWLLMVPLLFLACSM